MGAMVKQSNTEPRGPSLSRTTLSVLMGPQDANVLGNVHGGHVMKLVDEAGALTCMRHSGQRVVTIAVDQMTFKHPIRIGDLITLTSEISYVGRTSMEVEVSVEAENPTTGESWHTNTAYLVYVALDEDGKPVPVPPLEPETDRQRRRMALGEARQAYRLSQARQKQALDESAE